MYCQKSKKLVSVITIIAMVVTLIAAATAVSSAKTYKGKYWLKVNRKACVVTAYKRVNGKWKPIRAMLCTTGGKETPTPTGTWYMGYKSRWLHMVGEDGHSTYEQYTGLIIGKEQIYIHSVWYYKHSAKTQSVAAFNRLGKNGSHACVRVSTMDAKWVYDHCKRGTKITIYSSKNPGPLGKPAKFKFKSKKKMYWDPTDPSKKNPVFIMPRPVISIASSKKTVQYGKSYSLKSRVTAKDPNTNQNLTGYLKAYRYVSSTRKYVKASTLSTKKVGTYRLKYYVNDPYGRSQTRYFTVSVVDTAKPTISDSGYDGNVSIDSGYTNTNLLNGITAKQPSASRTSAITVTVSDGTTSKSLSNSEAKAYTFTSTGKYTVTYNVTNAYNSNIKAAPVTRTYTVTGTNN